MQVWTPPLDDAPPLNPDQRSGCAAHVVQMHGQLSGLGPYEPAGTDGVVHLLTDLMHLSADRGADFATLVRSAQRHYLEERLRPLAATALPLSVPSR